MEGEYFIVIGVLVNGSENLNLFDLMHKCMAIEAIAAFVWILLAVAACFLDAINAFGKFFHLVFPPGGSALRLGGGRERTFAVGATYTIRHYACGKFSSVFTL
jgi:hypothetical protein